MTAGVGGNFKLKCLCFFLETSVETLLPLFRILFLHYVCFVWLGLDYVCGWGFFFIYFKSSSHLLVFYIQAVSKHSSS